MKKIILNPEPPQKVLLNDLAGSEIVAYRCHESESICVLTQVSKQGRSEWGFINLSYPTSKPVFVKENFYDAVKAVINSREVRVFENQKDLIEAIYHKRF